MILFFLFSTPTCCDYYSHIKHTGLMYHHHHYHHHHHHHHHRHQHYNSHPIIGIKWTTVVYSQMLRNAHSFSHSVIHSVIQSFILSIVIFINCKCSTEGRPMNFYMKIWQQQQQQYMRECEVRPKQVRDMHTTAQFAIKASNSNSSRYNLRIS